MRTTVCRLVVAGALVAALSAGMRTSLEGQNPDEGGWSARTLRNFGQPVIPAFEGWYQEPDGTYQLCFGYWSGNTQESLDIPLGSNNFIEPSEFDGGQPTHFMPVPVTGYRKRYCVVTVNVPEDFGARRVVWTLRVNDQDYSAPGHLASSAYRLDEPDAPSRASAWERLAERNGIDDYSQIEEEDFSTWLDFNPGQAQGSIAPVLRFVDPVGPEGRGRSGMTAGPVTVAVGNPLTLSVFVDDPDGRPARWWVGWTKYKGPGEASFSQHEMVADYRYDNLATTSVTFGEPGDYVVLVQSIENIQSFERQCCWTNGYVEVTVTP